MIQSVWILSSLNSPCFHDNIMINQLFLQTNIETYTKMVIDGHACHVLKAANVKYFHIHWFIFWHREVPENFSRQTRIGPTF